MESRKEQADGGLDDDAWKRTYVQAFAWTMKTHHLNPADAEELVQEAIRQLLAAGGLAGLADQRELRKAIGSRINGLAVDRRRKKALRAVVLTEDGEPVDLADPTDPEKRVLDGELVRKAVTVLLERVAGDLLVSSIVMQILDGVEDPADQAQALGVDVREVYKARRRLSTHVEAVKKLKEGW